MLLLVAGVGRKVCDGGVVEEVQFAFAAFIEHGALPVGPFVASLVQAVAIPFPDGVWFVFLSRDKGNWF